MRPFSAGSYGDQLFFRDGQDALKSDDEQVVNQEGVNILWTSPHVLSLKAGDHVAHGRFDFALSLHAFPRRRRRISQMLAMLLGVGRDGQHVHVAHDRHS